MKKQIEKTISHIKDLEKWLGEVDNNLRYIGGTSLEEVYGQPLRIIIVRYSNAKEIPINLHGLFLQWWWILTLWQSLQFSYWI